MDRETGNEQRARPDGLTVPLHDATLQADLQLPAAARGLVIFAHGSESSRLSPRNRRLAAALGDQGLGTLLVDLLTPNEDTVDRISHQFRFDIDLLADRLVGVVDWTGRQPALRDLGLGCFGAGAGGAATLIAAAQRPDRIRAVVSRGGRVDLAGRWLARVKASSLLIVGARDVEIEAINQHALRELKVEKRLEVLAGASHLLEEPGAIEEVSGIAGGWFTTFLR
jgi:putative phosphoribosyl transferase